MTRIGTTTRNARMLAFAALSALLAVLLARPAGAVPVQAQYREIPGACDDPGDLALTHELVDAPASAPIDPDERIFADALLINQVECVGDDGIANDWNVRIVNLGSAYWENLHFVADEGVDFSLGNFDGEIEDLTMPGFTKAFRIDGTVTPGINNPLIGESMTVDEIFEPGETWSFLLSNFNATPVFDSIGAFAVSSAGSPPSTASILANRVQTVIVPEPTTLVLLSLGSCVLLRRPGRAHRS